VQAAGQPPDVGRAGALLRGEHAGGILERGTHIAQDHEAATAQPSAGPNRSECAGPSVGAGGPTHAHVHDVRACRQGGQDQLAAAGRGGSDGVALILGHEPEPARGCRLDDRRCAGRARGARHGRPPWRPCLRGDQREAGSDLAPEWVVDSGDPWLGAEGRRQGRECPLATVGDRAQVDRQPARLEARADRTRDLVGPQGSLERIRRDQDRPGYSARQRHPGSMSAARPA
jgi:hypothetical protein